MRSRTVTQIPRPAYLLLPVILLFFYMHSMAQTGSLSGKLAGIDSTMRSAKALSGATVSSGGISATTDSAGQYTLTLSPGKHIVTFSYPGYRTSADTIPISAGVNETRSIFLYMTPRSAKNKTP